MYVCYSYLRINYLHALSIILQSACNPSHAQICLDCGIVIGAQAREETTTRTDNTRKGYFIGNPELRKSNPYLQRFENCKITEADPEYKKTKGSYLTQRSIFVYS